MSATPELVVVALGGNAISPPRGGLSYAEERAAVAAAARELAGLAEAYGWRFLVVHGNGPQVGRLLGSEAAQDALDLHVAQTQGELGYLLATELTRQGAGPVPALVTRVQVDPEDPAFAEPTKAVGPVLKTRPDGPARELPRGGWRRLVASPAPLRVWEIDAIGALLETGHVVAGGGGGIAVDGTGTGLAAVVDKDRTAAMLATRLGAARLIIATDVAGVFANYHLESRRLIRRLDVAAARRALARGDYEPGTMAPKVESAATFAAATGRAALIGALGDLHAALAHRSGTEVVP